MRRPLEVYHNVPCFFEGQCVFMQSLQCFMPLAKTTFTTGQQHVEHILSVVLIEPFCGIGAIALQPPA